MRRRAACSSEALTASPSTARITISFISSFPPSSTVARTNTAALLRTVRASCTKLLEAIRRYCGEDYPIMLRLSGEEYVGKYGQHLDETLKVFKWAEEWGVDLLDVLRVGSMSHGSQSVEPPSFDQGWRKHLPKAAKQVVNIPVCAVSLVREPAYAEWLPRQWIHRLRRQRTRASCGSRLVQ